MVYLAHIMISRNLLPMLCKPELKYGVVGEVQRVNEEAWECLHG